MVETDRIKQRGGINGNKNPMLHDNISRIINWYKGRVTFEARKINNGFGWQARFLIMSFVMKNRFLLFQNISSTTPKNGKLTN